MPSPPDIHPLRPHTVYSSARWLAVRENIGRGPRTYATGPVPGYGPTGLVPVYDNPPMINPLYHPNHLLREIPPGVIPSSPSSALAFAGALSGYHADIPTVTSIPEERAVEAVLAEVRQIGHACPLLILPYLTSRAAGLLSAFSDVTVLFEGVDAWLDVPACSFAEYLESLRSYTRSMVRGDLDAFSRAGLSVAVERLGTCADRFAELVAESWRKYGASATPGEVLDYLNVIAEVFIGDAIMFTARREGVLVGGALGLRHRDVIYIREVGFDYPATTGAHAYFALLFHAPIIFAADLGIRRIHLGLSVDLTKRTRAALVEPVWTALLNVSLPDDVVAKVNSGRIAVLSAAIGSRQRARFMDLVAQIARP